MLLADCTTQADANGPKITTSWWHWQFVPQTQKGRNSKGNYSQRKNTVWRCPALVFPPNTPLQSEARVLKRVTLASPPSHLSFFHLSPPPPCLHPPPPPPSPSTTHLSGSGTKATSAAATSPPHLLLFHFIGDSCRETNSRSERNDVSVEGPLARAANLSHAVCCLLFPPAHRLAGSVCRAVMATDADPQKCESCRFLPAVNL